MGRKKKNKNEEDFEREAEEDKPKRKIKGDVKRSIAAVILFSLAAVSFLGFWSASGSLGNFIGKVSGLIFGWMKFVFPLFLLLLAVILLFRKETSFYVTKIFGLSSALVGLSGFIHWFYDPEKMISVAKGESGGGYLGYLVNFIFSKYLGEAGSLVAILAVLILGLILAFDFSIVHFLEKIRKKEELEEEKSEEISEQANLFSKENDSSMDKSVNPPNSTEMEGGDKDETKIGEEEVEKNIKKIEFVEGRDFFEGSEENFSEENQTDLNFRKRAIFSLKSLDSSSPNSKYSTQKGKERSWVYPHSDLLEESFGAAKGGDIEKNFELIEKTLKDFGIQVERGTAKVGPAVTQYSFRPAVGVKVAKILSLQNDLALALAAHSLRIEAPIPGQSLFGIEIPNKSSLVVRLRDMLEDDQFKRRQTNLTLALGKNVSGEGVFGDLSKMPHLMIAGATGTGKSVCINSVITTLLYQNSPDDLKFIMVDPKRVELSLFNGIPHLLTDVVVENGKVVNVLKWAVGEMESRYKLLEETGSRDVASYREKMYSGKKVRKKDPDTGEWKEEKLKNLPYIVIVIDELADLMGSHGKEVEGAIVRIAQMARAVGIHLIVSTQRPSVEVITGLIKANITTRVAFQVATQIDSRTILDMAGAEKLLGNGDMLYLSASSPKPRRLQGVFVSESEVRRVVKFIKDNNPQEENKEGQEGEIDREKITQNQQKEILEFRAPDEEGDDNELVKAAKEEILRSKKASASFLQRRLRIGYARAARVLDILEEQGVVGPADGAKPREIYGASKEESPVYEDATSDQEKRDKWQI